MTTTSPPMQTCATCGERWWDCHVCSSTPKLQVGTQMPWLGSHVKELEQRITALEADRKMLRQALQFAVDEQFGDVPVQFPLSKWIVDAQNALESTK